jgi:Beta-lactamase enzyme family
MVRMRTLSRTLAVVAISSCLLITRTPATPQAPKLDDLRKQLDSIAERVNGKLGYSIHHLNWIDRHGLKTTRLLYPWPISEALQRDEAALKKLFEPAMKWTMGVSTPNEMRTLMEMIVSGKAGTPAASDEMHRLLNHQYKDEGIGSQIPPWVMVASKGGRSDKSQSDLALVHSPSGAYALAVFIKESNDTRSGLQNERTQAIRAISRAVWRYYHPNDKWEPPAGVEKF